MKRAGQRERPRGASAALRPFALALALLAAPAGAALAEGAAEFDAAAQAAPAEPSDYRFEPYRGPTPATLRGARVVTTQEAEALWRGETAVFLDVLPRPPRPAGLPAGTLWRDLPHDSLPKAHWLPNVGFGALSPQTEEYFLSTLAALTGGDRDRTIVIFCLKNCWMSWNAAKRALAAGYRQVVWFPDGADGWKAAGLPLTPATVWQPPAATGAAKGSAAGN